MSTTTLLTSLFEYKAWTNQDLFAALRAIDAATHSTERHAALRILNHIHVVDRIFQANLECKSHGYSADPARRERTQAG